MDINKLLQKLNDAAPGIILNKTRFGKTEHLCLWIDIHRVQAAAELLKNDKDARLDWLENLSIAEIGDAWLITYFLRSSQSGRTLILRGSLSAPDHDEEVEVPSISGVWPMATAQELEMSEMFGIRFLLNDGTRLTGDGMKLLPKDWVGHPLRKRYVFPREFRGITHFRPVGMGEGDERMS